MNKYHPGQIEILNLDVFKRLDLESIKQGLPIELMMEQAGLQLAKRATAISENNKSFLIGVGPGNNGGGGLVACLVDRFYIQMMAGIPGEFNIQVQIPVLRQFIS